MPKRDNTLDVLVLILVLGSVEGIYRNLVRPWAQNKEPDIVGASMSGLSIHLLIGFLITQRMRP